MSNERNKRLLEALAIHIGMRTGQQVEPEELFDATRADIRWIQGYPVEDDEFYQLFATELIEFVESTQKPLTSTDMRRAAGRARYKIRAILKRFKTQLPSTLDVLSVHDVSPRSELVSVLKKHLADDELVLMESLMYELPAGEIADELGISAANLRQRKKRLLEKLRMHQREILDAIS